MHSTPESVSVCFLYNVILITLYVQFTPFPNFFHATFTLLHLTLLLNVSPAASTLPHASQAQLNSSTAENTTFIAAVEQDAQQSSPNQEPRSTNTLRLVPLPHSPVDSSTEEDSSLFRVIDVLWEEEV